MKTRVLSAVVMIAIVLPLLIIGGLPFKIFCIILSALSMYELLKAKEINKDLPIVMKLLSFMIMILFLALGNNYDATTEIPYKLPIILVLVFLVPVVFINDNKKYNIEDAFYLLGATSFLTISFGSIILISNMDVKYLLYLVLITVMTDTFAYLGGSLIGKHKLCKNISPNKTIEGSIIGTLVGVIVPTLFYIFVIKQNANVLNLVFITTILSVVGQIGDLVFSSIKRHYKIKDFSNLIPGHGGILDRFDSLIFVAITYLLLLNIF